jgi:2-amino-4-hydroxy-6-hydroxymethyldihydropteridine diphosphokinase
MNKKLVVAYIALGSNLDDPKWQIQTALNEINQLPNTFLCKHSSLYQSKPLGPQDQEDFINACAKIQTLLSPENLLFELQKMEQKHHRVRDRRWGPRTLDLDILLYGDLALNTKDLTIPHPEIANRAFVLYPLIEIEPDNPVFQALIRELKSSTVLTLLK